MKKVLIGGIGNVLLGDDGVGPYLALLLASRYEFADSVELVDLGTPALDLIDRISGRDAVILIDSVDAKAAPGAVLLYRKEAIMSLVPAGQMNAHSPALVDALLNARLFATPPTDVLLVGIKPASYDSGCSLTEPVKASLDEAIAVVLQELDRLGVEYRRKEHPSQPGIWWASVETLEPTLHS
jgi:hydrogenase maturation protease